MGIRKAWYLFFKYAPPNKAIAPIGVKLGMCGIILVTEAKSIRRIMLKYDKLILFMFLNQLTI